MAKIGPKEQRARELREAGAKRRGVSRGKLKVVGKVARAKASKR